MSLFASAQAEPEEILVEPDKYKDLFFEALKQKAITNYDKALISLEQCLALQPKSVEVLHEMGKNYLLLKDYKKAYESFEKGTKIDPSNKWLWVGMYDVCYQTEDYNQSIVIVTRLIEFDKAYKEDLTSLYMKTAQFDKALTLINQLNNEVGKSEKRELYKAQIMTDAKYQGAEKAYLLDQIRKDPNDEASYIALIYLYSNSNQEEKALEIAQKLEKQIPDSDWAQVSLFKFHLNNNEGDKAVASMNQVLKSDQIDNKIKHRIVNEFLIFTKKNPNYDSALEKAVAHFSDDKDVKTAKELGKFYHNQKDWEKAIKYYELDSRANPNDLETASLLLDVYSETAQYSLMSHMASDMIDKFPLQPEFYYYAGLAYNQLKEYKKAKEVLESGLDFIVNNSRLEANFHIQLGEAWHAMGDPKKKEMHFVKADKLLKQKTP